jgi:hypothetical protein
VVTADVHQRVMDQVIWPTVRGMAEEGNVYTGFLYAGLMIDKAGNPKVIEFNCRFGDPETQPVMLRLESSLVLLVEAVRQGPGQGRSAVGPPPSLGVVLAAGGYPATTPRATAINGLDAAADRRQGLPRRYRAQGWPGGHRRRPRAVRHRHGHTVAAAQQQAIAWPKSQLERQLLPQGHRLPGHRPRAR